MDKVQTKIKRFYRRVVYYRQSPVEGLMVFDRIANGQRTYFVPKNTGKCNVNCSSS